MVSEDSDQVVSGLLPVHRLRDLRNPDQPLTGPMPACGDEFDALREPLEVPLFHGVHRMLPEERDNRLQQLPTPPHDVAKEMLAVVVVPPVCDDLPHSEELSELVQAGETALALCHRELVRYLEAGLVASPAHPVWLPDEPNREAAFSVYKTDDPATLLDQPFLLIVRTRHVVTMVNARSDVTMSSAGYSDIPAYGQMRTVLLPARGAAIPTLGPFVVVTTPRPWS